MNFTRLPSSRKSVGCLVAEEFVTGCQGCLIQDLQIFVRVVAVLREIPGDRPLAGPTPAPIRRVAPRGRLRASTGDFPSY